MHDGWSRLNTVAVLALTIYAVAATTSLAQQWPTHAVRWVLPFGPGSGADTAARLITDKLQQTWGQPIVIDGKPGGDGLLSLQTVVSAKDDHTLFFGPSSIFVVQRYVHEDMSFDPETDLAPIAGVAKVQIAIAVPTSLGISTLAEFVALARAKPNETSYAVAPGFSEFVFDGFVKENGLAIAKVPYRDITKSPVDLGENKNPIMHAILRRDADLCADRQDQDHRHQRPRAIAHRPERSFGGRSRIPVLARQELGHCNRL